MYFKIAFNNVKKSFKDYTVYFLTLTFAVCIFYSFNSINSQSIMSKMSEGQSTYVKLMEQFISILSIGISFILGALIIYATNFLIKRRKKEFGIYMILGMKKRSMSIILFLETFYIGLISLAAGLILGLIFAQILSVFTAKLFVVEMVKYSFVISYQAIIKTILCFGIMFAVVMIFNVVIVSRYKLIDLLYANKKNESIKIRNIKISSLIFVVSLAVLAFAYYCIVKSGLDFYKLQFKVSIVSGIIGTGLFFYGLSSILLYLMKKNPNKYYNNLNCFSVKQIASKFNTNFISMTIICLMLLVTIGTLSCGLSVKEGMESVIESSTPFDASVEIVYLNDDHPNRVSIKDALKEKDYNLGENESVVPLKSYTYTNLSTREILKDYIEDNSFGDFMNLKAFDTVEMIPVSVYNDVMGFSNKEKVDLNDDELLIACNYQPIVEIAEKFINDNNSIKIDGKDFKIKQRKLIKESLITSPSATNLFDLIVPDYMVEGLEQSGEIINLNFSGSGKEDAENKLTSILTETMFNSNSEADKEKGYYIYGMTRQMCYDANRGISTIVLFIAIYLGIVFLLSSAAVLALQQLSLCNESIERYRVLRKIGATKKQINRSIFVQVSTFFILPLVLAVVHSYVGVKVVNSYLVALGSSNQLSSILLTILIMIVVYGGYFYATYISYKNVINNEFN